MATNEAKQERKALRRLEKELERKLDGAPPRRGKAVTSGAAVKGAGVRNASQMARKALGRRRGKRY